MSFWERIWTPIRFPAGCLGRRWYFAIFCVVTSACLTVLYRDFILSGRIFSSFDMIYAGIFFRSFLVKHVMAFGEIPKWNPYILCGLPYVGAIHGDIFYPLSFLKYFLSIPRAVGWTFIMHIFLAGLFAYAAARELRLSRPAAGLAGAVYMFSGWLNSLVKPGHDSKIYVTALFPLLIFFLHRAFRKQPFLNYTMVGVTLGCIILSPHPQLAYFCLWGTAAYALYNIASEFPREGRWRFLVRYSGLTAYSVVLGLSLSAIQFLPEFDYTYYYSSRNMYKDVFAFGTSWELHPEEAISLIVPEFTGADLDQSGIDYWGRNWSKDNSEYAGLAALMLAVLGLAYYKRRDKYFFAAMGVAALIYALGDTTPLFRYLYKIPFVNLTRAPSMIMFFFTLSVAILSGMGVEALIQRNRDDSGRRYKFLNVFVVAAPVLFLVGWYVFTHAGNEALNLYARICYRSLFDDPGKLHAAQINLESVRAGFGFAFILATVFAVVVFIACRGRMGRAALFLLPLLAIADGYHIDRRFAETVDIGDSFERSPLIAYLQEHAGYHRMFAHAMDELPLHLYYHGLCSPRGYHSNESTSYHQLLGWGPGGIANSINPRFSRLAGVKYILAPAGIDLSGFGYGDDLTLAATFDQISVYEDWGCFARTYLVGKYRVISDRNDLLKAIFAGDDDMRRIVYVEAAPGQEIDSVSAPGDSAKIISYAPDSVVIAASCASPKILTLSDAYYKAWRVYVDGKEKISLRTYGEFRGVVLDPGQHTVVWKYESSAYATGWMLTLAALLYVIVVMTCFLFRRYSQVVEFRSHTCRWGFADRRRIDP